MANLLQRQLLLLLLLLLYCTTTRATASPRYNNINLTAPPKKHIHFLRPPALLHHIVNEAACQVTADDQQCDGSQEQGSNSAKQQRRSRVALNNPIWEYQFVELWPTNGTDEQIEPTSPPSSHHQLNNLPNQFALCRYFTPLWPFQNRLLCTVADVTGIDRAHF